MIVTALLPEIIIFSLFLVQLVFMAINVAGRNNKLFIFVSYFFLLLALLAAIDIYDLPSVYYLNNFIKTQPIFSAVRVALILVSILLSHIIFSSKEVPGTRKKEV